MCHARRSTAQAAFRLRSGIPRAPRTTKSGALRALQLAQERVVKVARGYGALPHERKVERFGREAAAEQLAGLFPHPENLILAEAIGNGLGRPLGVAKDRALSRGAALSLLRAPGCGADAGTWQKIDDL